jgi:chemotaxis methyl-accepting protein methylase
MDDQQFHQLLDFLGLSWKGYRKVRKGVQKRMDRYMWGLGLRTRDSLLVALEKNPEQRAQVEKLMTVSISRFFRDRNLWNAIESYVLPAVVSKEKKKIKVWSAGCSSGEEVYSFKILWEEWGRNRDRTPELELRATDMNPELIDRARTGVYSSGSLKEVPEEWRSKYFSPVKANRWTISDFLKEGIHWKVHNLLIDEPPSKEFQIIFLRNNLLTYYKVETLRPAVAKLIETLSPRGFLIVGAHEKLPQEFTELTPFPHHPNIFQKISSLPSPF